MQPWPQMDQALRYQICFLHQHTLWLSSAGPSLLMPPPHGGLSMLGRVLPRGSTPFATPHHTPRLPMIHPAMMPYRYHTQPPILHQHVNIVVLDSPHRMESRQMSMSMPSQATLPLLGTPQGQTGASPLSKASSLRQPFASVDRRPNTVESQRLRQLNPPRRTQNMPKTLPMQTGKVAAVVKPATRQASVKMAASGPPARTAPSRSQTLPVRPMSRAASAPAALPRIKELTKPMTSKSGSSVPAMLPVFPSATAAPSAAVGSQTSLLSATAPSAALWPLREGEQVEHKGKVAYIWSVSSKTNASARVEIKYVETGETKRVPLRELQRPLATRNVSAAGNLARASSVFENRLSM